MLIHLNQDSSLHPASIIQHNPSPSSHPSYLPFIPPFLFLPSFPYPFHFTFLRLLLSSPSSFPSHSPPLLLSSLLSPPTIQYPQPLHFNLTSTSSSTYPQFPTFPSPRSRAISLWTSIGSFLSRGPSDRSPLPLDQASFHIGARSKSHQASTSSEGGCILAAVVVGTSPRDDNASFGWSSQRAKKASL